MSRNHLPSEYMDNRSLDLDLEDMMYFLNRSRSTSMNLHTVDVDLDLDLLNIYLAEPSTCRSLDLDL